MKNIYKYVIAFAMIVGFGACTDNFDDINSNNNVPSISQADPKMLLTTSIESMTNRVHEIFLGHEMGSCWVQHMAKVQYTDEDRYIPRASVINNTWNSLYAASGQDIAAILEIAESKNLKNYKGVALVLKVYIVSLLTDMFGDVPYSQAWQGSAATPILSPAFDKQSDIYPDLVAKLKEANDLLGSGTEDVEGDILYDGDLDKWKSFANSLRLRLLLRMSAKVDVSAQMKEIIDNPTTYPVFTSNDDNAALIYLGSAPNNNPINENRKTRDDHRVSKTLVDIMYADAIGSEYDYRIHCYASETEGAGDFEGLPNGLRAADAAAYKTNGLSYTSKIGSYFTQATAPGMLMSYAELCFILAEAAHKNYISGGETAAAEYYTKGIKASYMQFADGINDGIVSYYGVAEGTYVVGKGDANDPLEWFLADGGWTYDSSKAMEQIGVQKWIALFDQGLQANFEQRRIGYPVLVAPVENANNNKVPVRFYYPSDEYARNKKNVEAAVASQGKDDLNTKVWWNK